MAGVSPAELSVLVIDDDAVLRELLAMLLGAEGHTVVVAESAEEAQKLLAKQKPDVILTDLHLPGTETVELLEKLRAAGPLVLGMSASEPEPKVRGLLQGFIPKPFGAAEFDAAVERAREAGAVPDEPASELQCGGGPVLDPDVYRQLAGALPASALRELYEMTLRDVRTRLEAIRAAFARGDTDTCRSEAHAMKGGCGMVGAAELRAMAAAIEAGAPADTPRLEEIAAASERLRRMLDTLS